LKKVKIIFLFFLWIIFFPIMFFYSIIGDIIEGLFTYIEKDICLILIPFVFLIITIIILLKPDNA
jgi:hypothetical protein